jgi:hypothetical protein
MVSPWAPSNRLKLGQIWLALAPTGWPSGLLSMDRPFWAIFTTANALHAGLRTQRRQHRRLVRRSDLSF